MRPVLLTFIALIVAACASLPAAPPTASPAMQARNKITFDLGAIDEHGMVGSEDGKRSFAYEFCVPDDTDKLAEVKSIDPSLQCTLGSPGRIRCSRDQHLCIGHGGAAETILRLAALDYIARIDPFYGE